MPDLQAYDTDTIGAFTIEADGGDGATTTYRFSSIQPDGSRQIQRTVAGGEESPFPGFILGRLEDATALPPEKSTDKKMLRFFIRMVSEIRLGDRVAMQRTRSNEMHISGPVTRITTPD